MPTTKNNAVSVRANQSIAQAVERFYSEAWDIPVTVLDSAYYRGSVLGSGTIDGYVLLNTGETVLWHVSDNGEAWFEDTTTDEDE